MNLRIEDDAHHLILILNHDYLEGSAIREINNLILNSKVRRLVVHVVSPDGRPNYLEKLKPILTSIMSCSLVVRYEGYTKEDLRNLLKSQKRDNTTVLMSNDDRGFKEVLQELGFNYKFLEGVNYG